MRTSETEHQCTPHPTLVCRRDASPHPMDAISRSVDCFLVLVTPEGSVDFRLINNNDRNLMSVPYKAASRRLRHVRVFDALFWG